MAAILSCTFIKSSEKLCHCIRASAAAVLEAFLLAVHSWLKPLTSEAQTALMWPRCDPGAWQLSQIMVMKELYKELDINKKMKMHKDLQSGIWPEKCFNRQEEEKS